MKKPNLGNSLYSSTKNFSLNESVSKLDDIANLPKITGRKLAVLRTGIRTFSDANKIITESTGMKIAYSNDFNLSNFTEAELGDAEVMIFNKLGIALIGGEDEQIQILREKAQEFDFIDEKVVYVPNDLTQQLAVPSLWSLNDTRVTTSRFTGRDIKVAVLDTGLDLHHPDFQGRTISTASFVENETVQDAHGHGTHCIGTACGSTDFNGLRYGIASNAHIYAGKVLSNGGRGAQAYILAGIEWAANEGCKVISMSLGSPAALGQQFDIAYERAISYASANAVVVVAAGNDSNRQNNIVKPIGFPANSPSALAIAAIDAAKNIANFSNSALNPNTAIEIAAPGVNIYSSWPMPTRYRSISGTSMATPHIAGILALLFEAYPNYTVAQIKQELRNLAIPLPHPQADIGHGLGAAPQ